MIALTRHVHAPASVLIRQWVNNALQLCEKPVISRSTFAAAVVCGGIYSVAPPDVRSEMSRAQPTQARL